MQAAVVPAARARWKIEDVPTSDPGPNQVLIKIHASGLCYTDVHQTDGRLVMMGFEAKPLPVSPADMILRRIKVIGSQQNGREYLYEALDYVAAGKVKVIAETYPLKDVNKAYDRVAEGKVRFRAVITNA